MSAFRALMMSISASRRWVSLTSSLGRPEVSRGKGKARRGPTSVGLYGRRELSALALVGAVAGLEGLLVEKLR